MNPPEPSPDLTALERQLIERFREGPAAGFRARVLARVHQALEQHEAERPPESFWKFAAAVAAAMLLAINLSMSVANDAGLRLAGSLDPQGVERTAARLQELVPQLPEAEAHRQGLLLATRGRLVPAASARPGRGRGPGTDGLFARE